MSLYGGIDVEIAKSDVSKYLIILYFWFTGDNMVSTEQSMEVS